MATLASRRHSFTALVVDDEPSVRVIFGRFLAGIGAAALLAADNTEALARLEAIESGRGELDLLVTDIMRGNRKAGVKAEGADLVAAVREAHDDVLVNSCFRLRHLPIIIITGGGLECAFQLRDHSSDIVVLDKPVSVEHFYRAVSDALATYRHAVLSELHRVGLAIAWQDGSYRLVTAYAVPRQG